MGFKQLVFTTVPESFPQAFVAEQHGPARASRGTANLSIKEGEGKNGVMLGIYALEGDALKLCFDPQVQLRPENVKLGKKFD